MVWLFSGEVRGRDIIWLPVYTSAIGQPVMDYHYAILRYTTWLVIYFIHLFIKLRGKRRAAMTISLTSGTLKYSLLYVRVYIGRRSRCARLSYSRRHLLIRRFHFSSFRCQDMQPLATIYNSLPPPARRASVVDWFHGRNAYCTPGITLSS